jgi:hypothetical protein
VRQAVRTAEICALVGCAAGVPAAAFGSADFGAAVVAAAGGADLAGAASAGLAVVAAGAAGASTARTALWQLDERLDMFFCRHCSDASPPGGTLEQCAM